MASLSKKKMFELAQCARNWAEKTHFEQYNAKDLCGMCGIASAHLFQILKNAGIRPMIAANNAHVFLLLDDYVLDITACQFQDYLGEADTVEVLYRKQSDLVGRMGNNSPWIAHYYFNTVYDFNLWQSDWIDAQRAVMNWDVEFIKNPLAYQRKVVT
jgi:hypothetical protein